MKDDRQNPHAESSKDDFEISEAVLATMDETMENFAQGIVSPSIDLTEYKKVPMP